MDKAEKEQRELKKIKQKYPKIARMTMKDVIETTEFDKAYEEALKKAWLELRIYEGRIKAISRHPMRQLEYKHTLKLENFKSEYLKVIDMQSKLSAAQRTVITSIGSMAYTKAVEMLMKEYDTKRK